MQCSGCGYTKQGCVSDVAATEEIKKRLKSCLLEGFQFLSLMYIQNLTENPRKLPVHRGMIILRKR